MNTEDRPHGGTEAQPARRAVLRGMTRMATALGAAAILPSGAWAQGSRPVRIILPVNAGSGADGVVRVMSGGLSRALGHPTVVENLPGAGGITGTTQIVRGAKDGSVIGFVSNNHVVNPSVYRNVPFDAIEDITPITVIGATPFVLVAHPGLAAKNVPELVALAKAQPGALNYGSSGNGTILHLAAELFCSEAQVDIKHIPYRGMGPLTADVLGGQVQLAVIAVAVAAPLVKAGSLRAIGVTSAARSPLLPDVPTIAEQGLPRYAIDGWVAVIGPAGMARAEVQRINAAVKSTVELPEVRESLLAQGYVLKVNSPEEAGAYFRSEATRMAKLVRQANVKVD
jgi:tripartite-type tricarboxylate transporter receptor subunit TctC